MVEKTTSPDSSACCGPSISDGCLGRFEHYRKVALNTKPASPDLHEELVAELASIPGGFFEMGTRKSRFPEDRDAPRRKVKLSPFKIAPTTVTNAQFARFVEDTGYATVAEVEGWSIVFHLLLENNDEYSLSPPGLPWWRQVEGASWKAPQGPGSGLAEIQDHPVTHVCWFDALAYCTWAGLTLPTEAQWERAARGGLVKQKFPWGNQLEPDGKHMMNVWQGDFPHHNTREDGYLATAPAKSYEPNGYGLYNMTGNVWEWVQDYFADAPPPKGPLTDPQGPPEGIARAQRGGSFLCHVSYCDRYHVHSRTKNDPDSATSHTGFRVACS